MFPECKGLGAEEGRTYGSSRTVLPIPDLQEGRVTTSVIDNLLGQCTDKIIEDPQSVSRNVVDTPSHLRFSEER